MRLTPTNNEETLLERYQREHRVYEEFRMNKHTAGNLSAVDNSWEVSSIYAESGRCVAVCHINQDATEDTQAEYEIMKEANARRLVAAWNACEGISTEDLESERSASTGWVRTASKLLKATTERDSLRAVNAELMEALELIVSDRDKNANGPEQYVPKSASASVSYWSPSATMVHSEYIAKARAAIASARKQENPHG